MSENNRNNENVNNNENKTNDSKNYIIDIL